MSKISEMRVNIWNKYQGGKMLNVLEYNYPKTMQVTRIVAGVITLPLRVVAWIAKGLSWATYYVEEVIDYVEEEAEELNLLVSNVILVIAYKIILKSEEKENE